MASVYADPKLRSKRNYIATSSFNNQLYTYTITNPSQANNWTRTGALGATTGATAAICPQGRILRENGSRLYPDANPGISTLMVGVYDANSGLRGYIDPNAPIFAVFNSDKPVEMVDGGDNNTTTPHKGPPVFTTGDVIAGGEVKVGQQLQLASGTSTSAFSGTAGAVTFTPTSGTFYSMTATGNVTALSVASPPPSGTILTVIYSGNFIYTPVNTSFNTTTTFTPAAGGSVVITYVSNGTSLIELARNAISVTPTNPPAS